MRDRESPWKPRAPAPGARPRPPRADAAPVMDDAAPAHPRRDEELRLHRDEIHLRKSGTISLGQAGALNTENVLYYQCAP